MINVVTVALFNARGVTGVVTEVADPSNSPLCPRGVDPGQPCSEELLVCEYNPVLCCENPEPFGYSSSLTCVGGEWELSEAIITCPERCPSTPWVKLGRSVPLEQSQRRIVTGCWNRNNWKPNGPDVSANLATWYCPSGVVLSRDPANDCKFNFPCPPRET